jgi:outer membrane protein assembly factor BamB
MKREKATDFKVGDRFMCRGGYTMLITNIQFPISPGKIRLYAADVRTGETSWFTRYADPEDGCFKSPSGVASYDIVAYIPAEEYDASNSKVYRVGE